MKKTLIAAAVMATSGIAFAASNVTLYGVMDGGVLVSKAKKADTTVADLTLVPVGVLRVLKSLAMAIQLVSSSNKAST